MQELVCPLCRAAVVASAAGCPSCHLPIADVRRHAEGQRTTRGRSLARALKIRVTGAVLYTAAVAWTFVQLPDAIPFVVPGAVLGGGVLHVWKGKPWLGLVVFATIVIAVPLLLWPSLTTGFFSDLTNGR